MAPSAEPVPKTERPSFARVSSTNATIASRAVMADKYQIAAAGIQPSSAPQNSKHTINSILPSSSTSPSPNGSNDGLHTQTPHESSNSALNGQNVHLNGRNQQEPGLTIQNRPEVHVQAADGTSPPSKSVAAPDGLLLRSNTDEIGTLASSSDGDGKPPSLDGKSVASGTTFALDEKESLRPDDSASVQASAEDDDLGYPPGTGVPTSRMGSEDGVRAFRDQLHEIHAMEPSRRPQAAPSAGGAPQQGVLYVPPEGPGIGSVPRPSRQATVTADPSAATPDSKLLEALENPRDRIWVLKLEQDVIDFVKDAKESSLNLPQCNSFYRMLAHKIADYYQLGHSVDDSNSAVRLFRTPYCRIPQPLTGVVTPSTAASTPPPAGPQIKLLRRGVDSGPAIANGSSANSKTNSDDDSGDDKKKPVTREEREARYEAARLRIMGSAKPTESDSFKEKDESRSSSAAGKRSKKKQRDNSDDGFEARSAYSSFFAPTYTSSGGYTSQPVAYQNPQGANTAQYSTSGYPSQDANPFPQYGAQGANSQWGGSAYPGGDGNPSWYQAPQPYDINKNFNQAMSLQPQQMADQQSGAPSPYAQGYNQQSYGVPNTWQQQSFAGNQQPPATGFGMSPSFSDRSQASSYPSQMQQQQQQQPPNYPFGQLPSQNMGRVPSSLEHPLPGSWKSPHFNPQSQAFVPGPSNNTAFRPFTPQRPGTGASNTGPHVMPHPLERQMSSHSQNSSFGSPHHVMHNAGGPRMPAQPLTHPLPQPVFPRQPSPNVPLPPKPMPGSQMQVDQARQSPSNVHHQMSPQNSSIAKWGAPASLPAKPPPSAEPFDTSRFTPAQRTPSFNAAAAARLPGAGLSGFGPMQSLNGSPMASGSGSPARSR
ncbi:hypothetical protein Q7P37_008967 [Cladosporium fusiforme]